jgi:hypothetical protein
MNLHVSFSACCTFLFIHEQRSKNETRMNLRLTFNVNGPLGNLTSTKKGSIPLFIYNSLYWNNTLILSSVGYCKDVGFTFVMGPLDPGERSYTGLDMSAGFF